MQWKARKLNPPKTWGLGKMGYNRQAGALGLVWGSLFGAHLDPIWGPIYLGFIGPIFIYLGPIWGGALALLAGGVEMWLQV